MKKTRVAINGFGRIGRAFFKVALKRPEIEIIAINDLGDIKNMAYLLKYDTVYPHHEYKVETSDKKLIVNGKKFKFFCESDLIKLPWRELDIDMVVEATGVFSRYDKAQAHQTAGAKKVVITAPSKDSENEGTLGKTILMGINEDDLRTYTISSNGSCTTNAGSPVIAILDKALGIEKAILNTVHAYTASQSIVDSPNKKDFREGRAGAQNIIPSSTGAGIAVAKALPSMEGKFDGVAMRVPIVSGSIADITFIAKKDTNVEEINKILTKASKEERWKGIFRVTNDLIVSSDILVDPYASIADLSMTRVVGGNLVKVLAWYDNEMGYVYTLVDHVIKAGKAL